MAKKISVQNVAPVLSHNLVSIRLKYLTNMAGVNVVISDTVAKIVIIPFTW